MRIFYFFTHNQNIKHEEVKLNLHFLGSGMFTDTK